jgi:hypothetical protein
MSCNISVGRRVATPDSEQSIHWSETNAESIFGTGPTPTE